MSHFLKKMTARAAVFLSAVCLAGCSGRSISYESTLTDASDTDSVVSVAGSDGSGGVESVEPVSIEPAEVEAQVVEQLHTIGEVSSGENIYKKKLTNNAEEQITGVYVKDRWTDDWPDNLLSAGDSWKTGETRWFYYDASHAARKQSETGENPDFQVLLLFEGGEEAVLHDVSFADFEEAEILADDDLFYLRYTSITSKTVVSTLEEEREYMESDRRRNSESRTETDEDSADSAAESSAADGNADADPDSTEAADGQEETAEETEPLDSPDDSGEDDPGETASVSEGGEELTDF